MEDPDHIIKEILPLQPSQHELGLETSTTPQRRFQIGLNYLIRDANFMGINLINFSINEIHVNKSKDLDLLEKGKNGVATRRCFIERRIKLN